ncbi:hypothetical protein BJX62DRAFT_241540 [Aspergillus germanicus]
MSDNSRTCFFPSGAVASDSVPCSSDVYTSCCGTNDLFLSNGLCLSVDHQPYVLSRGGCTDPEWGSDCPQYCRDNNPEGGCSIVNLNYYLGTSTYCCGTLIANDSTVICPNNASDFQVPTGHALVGYAMLANISTLDAVTTSSSINDTVTNTTVVDSTSCTNGTCHSTAIGAGVGVPLGVIARASLIWAFFERKRAKGLLAASAAAATTSIEPAPTYQAQSHPASLQFGHATTVSELDGVKTPELDSR